jgi:chromate transporter
MLAGVMKKIIYYFAECHSSLRDAMMKIKIFSFRKSRRMEDPQNLDPINVNPPEGVSPVQLFLSFFRLGVTAFGGPAMVAHIGNLAVKRKKWLDHDTFRNGVALSQSIPGATAMQTAAYVGLKTGGLSGALASYIGFALPAFLFMTLLSSLYATSRNLPRVVSLFGGLQVIVVVIVIHATITFGKSNLKKSTDYFLMAASALALLLGVSPFIVIISAAIAGIRLARNDGQHSQRLPAYGHSQWAKNIIFLLIMVAVGLGSLYVFNLDYFRLVLLLMKIDLFAFGGGFASLPLMLAEIVHTHGWVNSKTFMDGIALGQITPGPIVITATFIGYLLYGLAGAALATIAIFTPSFILLVAAAPFFDSMGRSPLFKKALIGILASFVGLLFSVSIKFAFAVPWDLFRVLLAMVSFYALLKKVNIIYIVLIGAVVSILIV